jgi:hypothetical protein
MSADNGLIVCKIGNEFCVFLVCGARDAVKPKTSEKCLFKSESMEDTFKWANEYYDSFPRMPEDGGCYDEIEYPPRFIE